VAVISESLAKQSFGNADPLDKQVQCGLDSDKWMTVVGVVGDVRQESPAESPASALHADDATSVLRQPNSHCLADRSEATNTDERGAGTIAQMNPLIALRFTTMDAMVNESIASERFRAALISSFAGVGLLLGCWGSMERWHIRWRNGHSRLAYGWRLARRRVQSTHRAGTCCEAWPATALRWG